MVFKNTCWLNFIMKMGLLILLGVALAMPVQAQKKVLIATGEYAPWTGEKLKHDGFVNHVITKAFAHEGYEVEYQYFPWKRTDKVALEGKVDAVSYYYMSEQRSEEFYPSDEVSVETVVFFHLKSLEMKNWKTLEDLKDYSIGATMGYTYSKEFWEAANSGKLKVQSAISDYLNFKKLLRGRIQLFPSGIVNGYSLLSKEFDSSVIHLVTIHPTPLVKTTGHLWFPKLNDNSKQLVEVFNRGLHRVKKTGQYEKMTDQLLVGGYSIK